MTSRAAMEPQESSQAKKSESDAVASTASDASPSGHSPPTSAEPPTGAEPLTSAEPAENAEPPSSEDVDKFESAGGTRGVVIKRTSGILRRRGTWATPIGPNPNAQLPIAQPVKKEEAQTEDSADSESPSGAPSGRHSGRQAGISGRQSGRISARFADEKLPRGSRRLDYQGAAAQGSSDTGRYSKRLPRPGTGTRQALTQSKTGLRPLVTATVPDTERPFFKTPMGRYLIGLGAALVGLCLIFVVVELTLVDSGPRFLLAKAPPQDQVRRSRAAAIWSAVHQGEDPVVLAEELARLGESGVGDFLGLARRDETKWAVSTRALEVLRHLDARTEFRALCRLMRSRFALGEVAEERALEIDDLELWGLAETYRASNPRLERALKARGG